MCCDEGVRFVMMSGLRSEGFLQHESEANGFSESGKLAFLSNRGQFGGSVVVAHVDFDEA